MLFLSLVGAELVVKSCFQEKLNVVAVLDHPSPSLMSFVVLLKQKGGCVFFSLMLHSGQSYPGTQEQPDSRTGTHPEEQTKKASKQLRIKNYFKVYYVSYVCLILKSPHLMPRIITDNSIFKFSDFLYN